MGMDRSRGGSDSRLPLRAVEFHILLSLAAGERHGYGIILDIQARGETAVPDVGTMYRALARMAENGLIAAAAGARPRTRATSVATTTASPMQASGSRELKCGAWKR